MRHKLAPLQRSDRRLEVRLVVRCPWLAKLWAWVVALLSPRSGLRQALLLRGVRNGLEAYNRRDLQALVLAFHPDVESQAPPDHGQEGTLGFQPSYRGHDGYREFDADWRGVWGALRIEPQELIDLGDRFLIIARLTGRAVASGISLSQDVATLQTFDDAGMIIREQRYFDHSEALEAAGLGK